MEIPDESSARRMTRRHHTPFQTQLGDSRVIALQHAMIFGFAVLALLVSLAAWAGPQAKPNDAQGHFNLGTALSRKGDLDGAITEFRQAIRLKPDYADAHFNLGNALFRKRDLDNAIAEYRAAIRAKPDYADAHSNLGFALDDKGDRDDAIAEYRAAIRLQPELATPHYNLCDALEDKGDLDGAIAECRAAIRLKPDYAQAHFNLGFAFDGPGVKTVAIQIPLYLGTRSWSAQDHLKHTTIYVFVCRLSGFPDRSASKELALCKS